MARTITRFHFAVLASLVTVSGFAGGIASQRIFGESAARADDRPVTTNINVGPQGLSFRGPVGRVIARLTSDSSGGIFEVYNANEQPGARVRASSFAGGVDVLPSPQGAIPRAALPAVEPPQVVHDPFAERGPTRFGPRSPGF
jgi:hypothetical protein